MKHRVIMACVALRRQTGGQEQQRKRGSENRGPRIKHNFMDV